MITSSVNDAATYLHKGGLVAFATETVYGLGADASNQSAVERIFRAKGRPADHPLIVHVSGLSAAQFWVGRFEEQFALLANKFWPGPLSIVVPLHEQAPAFACAGQHTVGLRCPAHDQARALLHAFENLGGKGVAAPSANRFGKVSPTRAEHVLHDLGEDVDLILDGGASTVGIESSIVGLFDTGPVLLRLGAITAEQLALVLAREVITPEQVPRQFTVLPQVSGSLASHYAPDTPVELIAPASFTWRLNSLADTGEQFAVFARQTKPDALRYRANLLWEQAPLTAASYAQALYDALRRMDALATARIIIEDVPQGDPDPLWSAISDRLKRCAHPGAQTGLRIG